MKRRIYTAMLTLAALFTYTACEEECEYTVATKPLVTEQSVVTGSSDVTSTTAVLNGTVAGVESMSSSAYKVGFNYGSSAEALVNSVNATLADGAISAELTGLQNNTTLFYQAFVTLQGKLTYTGEVKSLVTTNAKVATVSATSVNYASAVVGAKYTDAPSNATCGIVVSTSADVEAVRAGLIVPCDKPFSADMSMTLSGLLPSTAYYYAGYLDLGTGVVYGDVKELNTAEEQFDLDNDLVDLGLSVKWARYNVGASDETQLGGLFGFGDLSGVSNSTDPADYASADVYKTARDVVYKATGGKATLPTAADFEELFALCQTEWVEQDGMTGYKFTGPNGNSIFLPAAGSRTANAVSQQEVKGRYATGTIGNPQTYAVSFEFGADFSSRATTPVYEALAVRGVSVAKNVPFVKEPLYNKWYLDTGQGEDLIQHVFEGPFTQWGITDTWATVSNGQPNIEQQIHWEMGTNNGWIGYDYGCDYGFMEFAEDGTMTVTRYVDTKDDAGVLVKRDTVVTIGKYTVNEADKSITVDEEIIAANTWLPNKKGELKILSLTEDGMQIMLDGGDGTYGYSLNYYSETKRTADERIVAYISCANSSWGGSWDYEVARLSPAELNGFHTFTYTGSTSDVMVFTLDFVKLLGKYPNAIVTVTDMKCDGESINFDASKFFYGDIENNGKYRIEFFNIFGKGSADGTVVSSPFSDATNAGSESAVNFESTLEITCYIALEPTFTPNLVAINPSWGGTWGFNTGDNFTVSINADNKFQVSKSTFDITYESTDHSAGSIMTFIEIADLYGAFPRAKATLDALYLDGEEVTGWDASQVLNSQESPKYRLELFNCYGATKDACAFGVREGDVIKELGFSSSIRTTFTVNSLY
jgi:hypothetical protein